MKFTYCPDCGGKLVPKTLGDEGDVPFCESCNRPFFPMFSTCVICLCVNESGEVALIKQSYMKTEHYILVSGYIKPGETAEYTAMREIEEEIGIAPESCHFALSVFYDKRDQLMLGFVCKVKKADMKLSCEVAEAKWCPENEVMNNLRGGSITVQLFEKYLELKEQNIL